MGRCKILGLLKLFLWYAPWISRASLPPSGVSLRVHHCEWLLWLKAWWPQHHLFTEILVMLFVPCFFCDPATVGNLISGSSAFSKSSLNTWKSLVHTLLKPSLKDFEHDLASMWNECNCVVAWTFFGIALLCYWNENWPFPVLWPLLSFPNLLAYWMQHFHSIIF